MIIEGAESDVPDHLKGRVEFMKHGLFELHTVQANVYFSRMVFRNWGDKYVLQALMGRHRFWSFDPGSRSSLRMCGR